MPILIFLERKGEIHGKITKINSEGWDMFSQKS